MVVALVVMAAPAFVVMMLVIVVMVVLMLMVMVVFMLMLVLVLAGFAGAAFLVVMLVMVLLAGKGQQLFLQAVFCSMASSSWAPVSCDQGVVTMGAFSLWARSSSTAAFSRSSLMESVRLRMMVLACSIWLL